MTPTIEKYLDTEKIRKIAKKQKYDEISFDEFIQFLDNILIKEESDGYDKTHIRQIYLYVNDYMILFVGERKKGMSVDWARAFSRHQVDEGDDNSPGVAYDAVLRINPEQAIADLKHYAELSNRDEFFVKHFAFLIEVDVPSPSPSVEHQADVYSLNYKFHIKRGKSKVFAHHYADLFSIGDYSHSWCMAEAAEYDKAISLGYSVAFALKYAPLMAKYLLGNDLNYEESLDNDEANIERKRLEEKFHNLKTDESLPFSFRLPDA